MNNRTSLFIILLFVSLLTSCNTYDLQYGKLYNDERRKLGIAEIPDNWTLTKQTSGNLRYSVVDKLDKFKIIFNKENYIGHIDKFIHIWDRHHEIDYFLVINNDKQTNYIMYYYYDNKEKKCECYDVDDGRMYNTRTINCNVIDSLFLE